MATPAVTDGKVVGTALAVDFTKLSIVDVTKSSYSVGSKAATSMGDNEKMV